MIWIGIPIGLLNASAQALSYLFSRRFVTGPGRNTRQLMALAHLWMGLFSLLLLPLLWRTPMAGWGGTWTALLGAAGFYLFAQTCLFWTMRQTEASRVSPMLGLKIVFLAAIVTALAREDLEPIQWLAAGLAVVATVALNHAGERLPLRALVGILLTCLGYACSDINISYLLEAIGGRDFGNATFAAALVYTVCLGYGLALYTAQPRASAEEWRLALPFALAWYLGMLFLFVSISLNGVVLAVILQSLRGPISIGLGVLVAGWGWHALERRQTKKDLLKQVLSALLMCLAIGLYVWGKQSFSEVAAESDTEAMPVSVAGS